MGNAGAHEESGRFGNTAVGPLSLGPFIISSFRALIV